MVSTVSVLIPAYNSAGHIRRSIDSVLNQTVLPLEILVINDGSTDDTEDIAKSYGGIVRVISKGRNYGLPAARNYGIQSAEGEWVAFLDSDDEWRPRKNEDAISLIESQDVDWCMVAQSFVSTEDPDVEQNTSDYSVCFVNYFSLVLQAKGGCPSSMMVKKEVFDKVGYFNEELTTGEDLNMWWRVALQIPVIGYVEKPLVKYYVDVPGSMTNSRRNEDKLVAFWKSVAQMSGSNEGSSDTELFIKVRDIFASKAVRFYIREGYYSAAEYVKTMAGVNYHPAMKILLKLPFPLSKLVFKFLYGVKNRSLLKVVLS